jgi:predicted DCC family thiol-disulfide oxidoreductase YuxK
VIKNEGIKPILLFDGVCTMCNSLVSFVIRRDPKRIFQFASLQSDTGQRLLQQAGLPTSQLNTFVLIEGNRYYTKSTAALHLFRRLGRLWTFLYLFIIVPRPLRDMVYHWIAKNRYKWFGKKEQCMLPTPDIKERFLD